MRHSLQLACLLSALAVLSSSLDATNGVSSLIQRGQGASRLTGRVDTRVRAGAAPSTAVVYAEPVDATAPTRAGTFTVVQKNKSFQPRVLAVPNGSAIVFQNTDDIFHNVFSLSSPLPFDLGLYRSGASKTRAFTQPSMYHVFCNIHSQMTAWIVVAPSPFVTTTAADGGWQLDVPPGRYRVTALSERAAPLSVDARAEAIPGAPLAFTLDESTFVQSTHLDKFGKPYPTSYK